MINLYSSRVHPRRVFPTNNWIEGLSDYNKTGGAYVWAQGVDYRSEPSQLKLLPAAVQETNIFTDLGKWGEQVIGKTVPVINPTNLITNPNFATGTTGWGLDADFTRSNDDAFVGSWSIKQVSVSNFRNFYSNPDITVTPNTDYILSFAYKMVATGLVPLIEIDGVDFTSNTNVLGSQIPLNDTAGKWVTVSFQFNSGPYTSLQIRIFNNNAAVTAHYSNFSFTQVNAISTYVLGNTGSIYKRNALGTWSFLHAQPNSHGNGLGYYGQDDNIYYLNDNTIGRFGPVSSSTPIFSDDFLTALGGVPTNTNSLLLVAANSDYANKATPSSNVLITGDIALEAFIKPTSLPAVGSTMTLMGVWKESTNQRAWKLDILGISGVFGTGADGSLTISGNTTDTPIDSACSGQQGTNQLFANNASFAAGQKILIIQMQGTGAGTYQETTIQAYDSTNHIITTQDNLNFNYNSSGNNTAQVLVGKQYTNVTVNSGIVWTPKAWNGTTGGILYFFANGTITVNGIIDGNGYSPPGISTANGGGFRGGQYSGLNTHNAGYSGEGSGGPSSLGATGPNGNGGGAGPYSSSTQFGGGSGGSYGTQGTSGVTQNIAASSPGSIVGNFNENVLFLGGGGASGANSDNSDAGVGGNGGAIVFMYGQTINITASGVVRSNGGNGGTASVGGASSGGAAGSGGSLLFKSQSFFSTGTITANGGVHGQGQSGNRNGGDGGVGRIAMYYLSTINQSSTPGAYTLQDNTLVTSISYQARIGISDNGTSFEYLTQNLKALALNQWDRIQVSWAAAISTASFFENGKPIGVAVGTKTSINGASTADFAIGANFTSAYANFLDAEVNDFRVWNGQRTGQQFAAYNLFNFQGVGTGLVGNWFTTASANDQYSTNPNNLTLQGTPTPGYVTDVPYPGATTRMDIDQTGGSTANTTALDTTLVEADKIPFVPAYDPQKSFQVQIAAKGTGNWTLVIHDGLNRVVATMTVANANLPASGLYEFIYPATFRPVVGATYHAHLYSSVNDGTVKSTTANTYNTILFTTYFQFLVADTEFHPVFPIVNKVAFGNGNYLAMIDAAGGDGIGSWINFGTGAYNPMRLKFPAGWRVRCITTWRGFYAIGLWRGPTVKDFDQGLVILWDGTSTTYNDFFFVPEGAINAMYGENGTLYIIAGYKGDLLEYTGGDSAVRVKRLPKVGTGNYIEVAPGGLTFWQGLLRIAASYRNNSGTFVNAVYTWGTLIPDKDPKSLSCDFPISSGDTGAGVSLGAIVPVGGNLISCWQNNGKFGADNINVLNPPQAHGTIEALIDDLGFYWKPKTVLTVRADHFPLAAGANVDVKYKLSYEANWHNNGLAKQNVGDIFTRLPLPPAPNTNYPTSEWRSIQIALDLYASQGVSPIVVEFGHHSDMNITESDEGQY